jgi:hypothetical protein
VGGKIVYGEEDVPKFGQLPFDHFILVSKAHRGAIRIKLDIQQD